MTASLSDGGPAACCQPMVVVVACMIPSTRKDKESRSSRRAQPSQQVRAHTRTACGRLEPGHAAHDTVSVSEQNGVLRETSGHTAGQENLMELRHWIESRNAHAYRIVVMSNTSRTRRARILIIRPECDVHRPRLAAATDHHSTRSAAAALWAAALRERARSPLRLSGEPPASVPHPRARCRPSRSRPARRQPARPWRRAAAAARPRRLTLRLPAAGPSHRCGSRPCRSRRQ